MDDAIEVYRSATEANDIDRLMTAFAPDAELVSPLSGRMVFRGADDLRHLAAAVYGTLKDLRWSEPIGDGDRRVSTASAGSGPCG